MKGYKKSKKNTLSTEEVIAIIKDFQENGETFENEVKINRLLSQYVDFIYHLGHKFYPTYMKSTEQIEEVQQAGMRGIVVAMKSFDTSRDVAFQTWAQRFILNEIREYISVEINGCSVYFNKNLKKVRNVMKEFEALEIPYTDEDIIMSLIDKEEGLSEKVIRDCLAFINADGKISLENYAVGEGDDSVSLADSLVSENVDFQDPSQIYEKNTEDATLFDRVHAVLDDDEFQVLMLACVEKVAPKDIAKKYNKDILTINRIINAATTKLQVAFGNEYAKSNRDTMEDISFGDFFIGIKENLSDISFDDFKLA